MFQYTNTIILNDNLDSSGIAKWTAQAQVDGIPASGESPAVPGTQGSLDVKRVMKFVKDNVKAIYKRAANDPVLSTAEFDMSNNGAGVYRVILYMRLSGSNNSYYANDMVFKGKPLAYEFSVTEDDTASDIATNAKKAIDRMMSLYGDKYITTSVAGTKLTIQGTDEYQIFTMAKIQKFDPTVNSALIGGEFVDSIEATIKNGKPGFGTYTQIIKDLRLPTMEAIRFGGINQEELPILGAKYNQYTIHYCKDRGIMGSDAVGDTVTSMTTHVFFVNTAIATVFEAALGNIGTVEEVK